MWTRLYLKREYEYVTICDVQSSIGISHSFFSFHTRGKTWRRRLCPRQECGVWTLLSELLQAHSAWSPKDPRMRPPAYFLFLVSMVQCFTARETWDSSFSFSASRRQLPVTETQENLAQSTKPSLKLPEENFLKGH